LSQADIEELVVLESQGKTFPITDAYKWSICIFQAWYRELLLKDDWDDDWNQYDHFCHEYHKDKVTTMPAPAVPIGYKQANLWTLLPDGTKTYIEIQAISLHSRR
jgi:hypothetical protein